MTASLSPSLTDGQTAPETDIPALVQQKCGACHRTPRPGAVARDGWPAILKTMFDWTLEKPLPLTQREADLITDFYLRHSPEALPDIPDDYSPPLLDFEKLRVGELTVHQRPRVTSLKFADIDGDGADDDIIVTDSLNFAISWLREEGGTWRETVLARANGPVHATPVDIDLDGDLDLGISAMGEIYPSDELTGEYHLLLNEGNGEFRRMTLLDGGVARITDCAPADYDGDGDIDIVLALFGWRLTGGLCLLEQVAPLQFVRREIAEINGAMRVIPAHLDDDDRIDFLTLITQQHEIIARFLNEGDLTFRSEIIAQATHPTFGSSSIRLHDLDGDGDEDILYTNGDMMDHNPVPKPYHGVRWLENRDWQYRLHHLASMPGCYDAEPYDLDGDGDLDVVFSALYFHWHEHDFPSLAWLENKGGFQEFVARRIAYSPSNLVNIAVGDANGDGRADIVGGGMHVPGPLGRVGRLTLWLQK